MRVQIKLEGLRVGSHQDSEKLFSADREKNQPMAGGLR
jgi:hypothetical protein